ncbi:hypothetical protein [Pseudoprimorskyibacter insulae]|uniref:Uncharacterized protein n=1 Tax=Pseudoprimorskyibacter insulae TaxID=1695997 RepID=A0A2R8AVS3_9RHOB|nr:hypothetical protein [Pseudoprimorskyibacter insulae]SPF80132.1 hypothetical protein PRI8871_01935 [Pseudoprimorskyibacter insulae]
MRKTGIVLLSATLVLASCGAVRDSRINPFNWFGKSKSRAVATDTKEVNPLIPVARRGLFSGPDEVSEGVLIDQIADLVVERRVGGAVIRARGIAPSLGISNARLVKVEEASTGGDLVMELRYEPLPTAILGGSDDQRSVVVAASLTANELAEFRRITVRGARNERTTTRR